MMDYISKTLQSFKWGRSATVAVDRTDNPAAGIQTTDKGVVTGNPGTVVKLVIHKTDVCTRRDQSRSTRKTAEVGPLGPNPTPVYSAKGPTIKTSVESEAEFDIAFD